MEYPIRFNSAVIPPRPSGSASATAQSRFCRSSKTLKKGIDFSETIAKMLPSILEYSNFLTFMQGKLRNSYLRTMPNSVDITRWRPFG